MATYTPTADPANIAAVQDILKEVFPSDQIESQLYEDLVLLDAIEADVTEYTDSAGLRAVVPIKTGRTAGISARGIGQALGVPGHQRVQRAAYDYKHLYLQVQVYGPVVARMKTDRQACAREIEFEVSNGIKDFQKDYVRQFQGAGDGAITVAALPGGVSSSTILLGAANYPVIERGWLYPGMAIDVGTVANPVLDTGGNVIQSVVDSVSAPAVVVANATATTAGSHISRYGNRDATGGGTSYEINGFGNIVSDTAVLGGLNPATEPRWKAVREHNSGTPRALSVDLMLTTSRKIRQQGGMVDFVYGDLVQEQRYYNLVNPQVRYAGDKNLNSGGNSSKGLGLDFQATQFLADPEALPGRILFGRKKAIKVYSAGKLAWQNQTTGGEILAWQQGFDAFVARAAKYCQIGTDHRNALGFLADLS